MLDRDSVLQSFFYPPCFASFSLVLIRDLLLLNYKKYVIYLVLSQQHRTENDTKSITRCHLSHFTHTFSRFP